MEQSSQVPGANAPSTSSSRTPGPLRKRSISGAGGLLSKLPFMRSSDRPRSRHSADDLDPSVASSYSSQVLSSEAYSQGNHLSLPQPVLQPVLQQQQVQQHKTRRRRGSLRKVALLGRGAQRERRESRSLSIDTKQATVQSIMDGTGDKRGGFTSSPSPSSDGDKTPSGNANRNGEGYGLGISDITPRPSMDGYASRSVSAASNLQVSRTAPTSRAAQIVIPNGSQHHIIDTESILASPTISYSTTDEEDALHMGGSRPPSPSLSSSSTSLLRPQRSSVSSGSESYFPALSHSHTRPLGLGTSSPSSLHTMPSIQRRRSATTQRPKSPLALTSLAGLSSTPLPPPDADWDYSETEWWGWVVLIVTWAVFVTGMGSCLGVWSWAWDVGTTPYAPPELEDDPTLPIVGYYTALIILTGVMAWVWVVIAWVGMKYFRHARVSGD